MTTRKSVLREVEEFRLAVELVELGARLQVLESEVAISRDRLTRLYKELRGVSPPKGQLPSSPEWFLTWRPNVHASLFLSAYRFLMARGKQSRIRCIVSAYRLYVEHVSLTGEELTLSFTRAWTLLRFLTPVRWSVPHANAVAVRSSGTSMTCRPTLSVDCARRPHAQPREKAGYVSESLRCARRLAANDIHRTRSDESPEGRIPP
jgi:hypothetical protein